ncbi:zinc ABC transporter substrate-binding protein [Patescibacteria group bacterium]|nr:zinc ABC transporter substrate-binding protein [Patescibacteria group bacterium]
MKKISNSIIILTLLISVAIITGCNLNNSQSPADSKIKIIVSILPLTEFASQVGGDKVTVEAIIPPGYEPHSYEITPQQLTQIAKADLYVKAGRVEFEKTNMDKIVAQNVNMKVIDGSVGITLRDLTNHHHTDEPESIHELEDNTHADKIDQPDPHTWLSITNAKIYSQNITAALSEIDPNNKNYYEQNREEYVQELSETDTYLKEKLGQLDNKRIIVYHPSFGYLLDDYGLIQVPVEIDGKEPTAAQLEELIAEAKKEGAETVFVQKQFSPKNAETVATEINGNVVQIDPLAADFITNLKKIGDAIANN